MNNLDVIQYSQPSDFKSCYEIINMKHSQPHFFHIFYNNEP